jgi:hypothetical protein
LNPRPVKEFTMNWKLLLPALVLAFGVSACASFDYGEGAGWEPYEEAPEGQEPKRVVYVLGIDGMD